jgi:hypothetical protein
MKVQWDPGRREGVRAASAPLLRRSRNVRPPGARVVGGSPPASSVTHLPMAPVGPGGWEEGPVALACIGRCTALYAGSMDTAVVALGHALLAFGVNMAESDSPPTRRDPASAVRGLEPRYGDVASAELETDSKVTQSKRLPTWPLEVLKYVVYDPDVTGKEHVQFVLNRRLETSKANASHDLLARGALCSPQTIAHETASYYC